ncbi:MAG: hypothetical protein JWO76_1916 [Nocardioides sp.]|nr:hypothetical protein [Nocardioides sp.]
MTEPAAPPRPRQVTLAAWLIMLGSVFVVLSAFERVAGLQTLETQQSVERFLSEPPGDGLGLGVQGVLDLLRTLAMVAGGFAAAAAILGYHVLRRSRSARLALTILALPLFVTGLVAGGFMSSVVAAAAVMLWFQPARDWFDGIAREARPELAPAPAPEAPPPPRTEARPVVGFGSSDKPSTVAGPPASPSFPTAAPGWPTEPTRAGSARPPAVIWACLMTWACAGLAVVLMGASIAVLAGNPDLVLDELRRQNPDLAAQGVTDTMVLNVTFVLGGIIVAWSLAAVALAVLTFRRVNWARIALVVSAALAAVLCLLATITQVLMALPLAACVVTLALLVRPDIRAWFH